MGTLVGVIRTTPTPWLVRLGTAYVELFRNVPLLVQMFLWYFVLPELLPTQDPRGPRFRRVAGLAGRRIPGPGDDARRERGVQYPPQDAVRCAHRAQRARAAHLRDAPARRGTDHARGAGRGIRRLARARAPDRGERLREGAERSESARRGDGDPGVSAGALASNPLPWWEKLTMDVSLWGTFYGNRTTRDGRRSPDADPASLDDHARHFTSSIGRLSRALQMESCP